jgi:hypothetical protein
VRGRNPRSTCLVVVTLRLGVPPGWDLGRGSARQLTSRNCRAPEPPPHAWGKGPGMFLRNGRAALRPGEQWALITEYVEVESGGKDDRPSSPVHRHAVG